MTFKQFTASWWFWLLCVATAMIRGFLVRWDVTNWCLLALFGVTGICRLFSGSIREFALRKLAERLANMSVEQRERELQRVSPEQREWVLNELKKGQAQ